MTRDEILKMEAGDRMNIIIAKTIMKWHSHAYRDEWLDSDGKYMSPISGDMENNGWEPSTDMGAAWDVVEKMIANGFIPDITTCSFVPERIDMRWECELIDINAKVYSPILGLGSTAAVAICRSALLAVMEKDA